MKHIGLLLAVMLFSWYSMAQNAGPTLTVRSEYLDERDTLEVCIWDDLIGYEGLAPKRIFRAINQHGEYHFQIDTLGDNAFMGLYFSYQKSKGKHGYGLLECFRIRETDDVVIHMVPQKGEFIPVGGGYDDGEPIFASNWKFTFEGEGSLRFQLEQELKEFLRTKKVHEPLDPVKAELSIFKQSIHNLQQATDILETYKDKIKHSDYALLQMDMLGNLNSEVIAHLQRMKALAALKNEDIRLEGIVHILNLQDSIYGNLLVDKADIVVNSPAALHYYYNQLNLMYSIKIPKYDLGTIVQKIRTRIGDRRLSDRLIANLMIDKFQHYSDADLYRSVLDNVQDTYARLRIQGLSGIVSGGMFPDFDLPDSNGVRRRLSDYRGKVVLLDFWYMGCLPCRAFIKHTVFPLAEQFRDDEEVEIVLISLDNRETLQRAMGEGVLPPDVVSLYTDNKKFSHEYIKRLNLRGYPYPVLIAKDGKMIMGGSTIKSSNLEDVIRHHKEGGE